MAIPQSIEDVLNPNFGLSPIVDNIELEAWLIFLPPAMHRVCEYHANCKFEHEKAEKKLEVVETQELLLLDESMNVTTKKMVVKAKENYIKAQDAALEAKHKTHLAEVNVRFIEERSGSIRKIATLRANTQNYAEDVDYTVKGRRSGQNFQRNNAPVQQQPVANNGWGNNNSFASEQPFIPQPPQQGFQAPQQNSFFQPQQPMNPIPQGGFMQQQF